MFTGLLGEQLLVRFLHFLKGQFFLVFLSVLIGPRLFFLSPQLTGI